MYICNIYSIFNIFCSYALSFEDKELMKQIFQFLGDVRMERMFFKASSNNIIL